MIHELKCWNEFFEPLSDGRKTFEIRKNDRGFHTGDILVLKEWNPFTEEYSGRVMQVKVVWMIFAEEATVSGLLPNHVAMSVRPAHEPNTAAEIAIAALQLEEEKTFV
jgi:ASC-1-like (ASCH) protein